MTNPNSLQKDRQDEARRVQQADEKVRELEEEVERLREALFTVRRGLQGIALATDEETTREDVKHAMAKIVTALNK
jgi:TolA-binding protein